MVRVAGERLGTCAVPLRVCGVPVGERREVIPQSRVIVALAAGDTLFDFDARQRCRAVLCSCSRRDGHDRESVQSDANKERCHDSFLSLVNQ
jgi:hypothetical protein